MVRDTVADGTGLRDDAAAMIEQMRIKCSGHVRENRIATGAIDAEVEFPVRDKIAHRVVDRRFLNIDLAVQPGQGRRVDTLRRHSRYPRLDQQARIMHIPQPPARRPRRHPRQCHVAQVVGDHDCPRTLHDRKHAARGQDQQRSPDGFATDTQSRSQFTLCREGIAHR